MSADLSGEITTIATAVLAVFAIVTAAFAFLAFRKQTEEVRAIERQVTDQEELTRQQAELLKVQSGQLELQRQQLALDAAERRRAQAERVFVGALRTPGKQVSTYAMNASDLPIFGVQLWSIGSHDLSDPVDLGVILPGDRTSTLALVFDTEDDAMARTILTFRDTTSRRWVRLPNGALSKQPCSTTRDSVLAILREKGQADWGRRMLPQSSGEASAASPLW